MWFISTGKSFINKFNRAGFAVLVLVLSVIDSCKESEIYPDIPAIEFKGIEFTTEPLTGDTLWKVYIGYKDGNGDIGLDSKDTFPPFNAVLDSFQVNHNPYYNNIHADYFELRNGKWIPLINPESKDTVHYASRIQNITPDGKYKAIRGTIEWEDFLPLYNNRADTMKLKIWIYDRALHKSNVVESPITILP